MNNKAEDTFGERPLPRFEVDPQVLRRRTRRDFLLFGAGAVAALTGAGSLLPQETLTRLGLCRNINTPGKEWLLNRALRIDDDVAETLYSPSRTVPTYSKSQITPLKNNYNGVTPDPAYLPGWHLTLDGLASGVSVALDIRNLMTRFSMHEQVTRLFLPACVAGEVGAGRVVSQSRCFRKSRPLLLLDRPGDGPPSPNAARHAFKRSASYGGAQSAALPAGTCKTRPEECEGNYQADLCCAGAARLLGRTWLFPLRRNLTSASFSDDFKMGFAFGISRGILLR